ncbi:hypothetical protein AAG570_010483 [Ranatra chinensis]|uniref:Uncharacterized protein n=1 Tax=Ranatra chinensis TaxID=642074 RepID=A0ABD0YMN1_9HEMI
MRRALYGLRKWVNFLAHQWVGPTFLLLGLAGAETSRVIVNCEEEASMKLNVRVREVVDTGCRGGGGGGRWGSRPGGGGPLCPLSHPPAAAWSVSLCGSVLLRLYLLPLSFLRPPLPLPVQGGQQPPQPQQQSIVAAGAQPTYYQLPNNPSQDVQPDRPIGYGAFGVVW